MDDNYLTESMYHDGFNKALLNGFKKYGEGCPYFVETGSQYGDGIAYAAMTGFDKLFSCELSERRYKYCVNRYKDYDNIYLHNATSVEALKLILPELDKKTFFWLDAHAEGGGVPTFEELDLIKEVSTEHTIMVDDVAVYFGDGSELERKLLEVNPEYTIERWNTLWEEEGRVTPDGYTMVAYLS